MTGGNTKGGLHRMMRIPKDEPIRDSELRKIHRAKIGTDVDIRGNDIPVTPLLKKRAIRAENWRK
jgi:hypothetical protein